MGARRQGRPIRIGPEGHPPGMVFSGAVLHSEAHPESCRAHRRGTSGSLRLRPPGLGVDRTPVLGNQAGWIGPHAAGDRRGDFPGRLFSRIHDSGVREMKAPLLVVLLAPAYLLSQPARDTCVECHSALDGAYQKPVALIKTRSEES